MSHPVRRIFVASSSEATALARLVGIVLEQVDSEPVLWTSEIFPPGATLLERIESLPAEVDGAILLMTPDVSCRRGGKKFATPVANILFEYGYLAARMTRNRVAICRSAGAHIPTDLSNIKFIEFGSSDPGLPEIPVRAAADITGRIQAVIATQSFPANRRILPPVSATRASCGDDR